MQADDRAVAEEKNAAELGDRVGEGEEERNTEAGDSNGDHHGESEFGIGATFVNETSLLHNLRPKGEDEADGSDHEVEACRGGG